MARYRVKYQLNTVYIPVYNCYYLNKEQQWDSKGSLQSACREPLEGNPFLIMNIGLRRECEIYFQDKKTKKTQLVVEHPANQEVVYKK